MVNCLKFKKQTMFLILLLVSVISCKGNVIDEDLGDPVKSLKTETAASIANKSINIMTFNILWDKVTTEPTQWVHRKQSMVNLVKRHRPDIIGIQEGFLHQVNYIKAEIKYEYFGWGTDDGNAHFNNPKTTQSLNPIMYDPNRLSVLGQGVFWYADKTDAPGKFKSDTHFSLTDDNRLKQADLLKTKIKEIAGTSAEIICIGDFNADPIRDQSYHALSNPNADMTIVDSKLICSSLPLGPSFTGSGLKVNSRSSGYEVDHVFIRNIPSCSAYKIITDYEGDYYPSDHFPVLSVLKFD